MTSRYMMLALLGSVALLCIGCGESPEDAFKEMKNSAEKGDWGAVYDRYDKKMQGQLDAMTQMMGGIAQIAEAGREDLGEDFSKLSGRDRFIRLSEKGGQMADDIKKVELVSCETDGDTATLTIRNADGEEKVKMVKEDGKWKFTSDQ